MIRWRAIDRAAAGLAFAGPLGVFLATAYPSVSFGDAGEYAVAAHAFGIPTAPGAPLFVLVAHVFSLAPFGDPVWRVSLLSALAVAFASLLAYRIVARLTAHAPVPDEDTAFGALIRAGAGLSAAMSLAFTGSVWRAAIRTSPDAWILLFAVLLIWLAVRWRDEADAQNASRLLMLLCYVFGLAAGVHWQLALLALPLTLLVWIRTRRMQDGSGLSSVVVSAAVMLIVYPGLLRFVPEGAIAAFPSLAPAHAMAAGYALLGAAVLAGGALLSFRIGLNAPYFAALCAALSLVGTTTSLVIPLRASQDPVLNAGGASDRERALAFYRGATLSGLPRDAADGEFGTDSVSGMRAWIGSMPAAIEGSFLRRFFWDTVGRQSDAPDSPPALFPGDAAESSASIVPLPHGPYPRLLFGIPLILGLAGLAWQFRFGTLMAGFLLAVFLISGAGFAALSGAGDAERASMFAGASAAFALWIGLGTAAVMRLVSQRGRRLPAAVLALLAVLAAVPGRSLAATWTAHDRHADRSARDLAYNMLQSCDRDGILFTEGDDDTFPLLCLQTLYGVRTDVLVANLGLLDAGWYCEQLASPRAGRAPLPTRFSIDGIRTLSTMDSASVRWLSLPADRREVRIPLERRDLDRFIADTFDGMPRYLADSLAGGRARTEAVFVLQSGYPVALGDSGRDVRFIRPWRDIMLEDAIVRSAWKRPVYFSVFCPDESLNGFEDYLRLDGAAMRLTPIRMSGGRSAVNARALSRSLLDRRADVTTTPDRRFIISETPEYADPSVRTCALVYRNAFMRLAQYQATLRGRGSRAMATLDAMHAAVPERRVPMDFRYAFDVAALLHRAGARERAERLFTAVERCCRDELARNPRQGQSVYSPYRYLLDIAVLRGDRASALSVLDRMQSLWPDAPDIASKRRDILADTTLRRTAPPADALRPPARRTAS